MPQRSIKVTFLFGVFALSGAALAEKLQITEDSQLLERIRSRMADHRSRLRNYTCHVVINRLIRPGNFGQIAHQDQLELEVAFVGERELFARSGETRFAEQAVDHIVPAGLIDNDSFGSHNELIFFGDAATFLFLGSTKKDGHQAFRFNFQVPERSSRITITGPAKTNIAVPYKGSLWVDAETSDVVRLEWETQITQTFSNIRAIHKVVRYKAARIGDSDFMLPLNSTLAAANKDGTYLLNIIRLERCLEFRGESTITFDAPAAGAAGSEQHATKSEH